MFLKAISMLGFAAPQGSVPLSLGFFPPTLDPSLCSDHFHLLSLPSFFPDPRNPHFGVSGGPPINGPVFLTSVPNILENEAKERPSRLDYYLITDKGHVGAFAQCGLIDN